MSELSESATVSKHGESCQKFQAVLASRIAYTTRVTASCTYAWAKDPAYILTAELHQMRGLYFQFSRVNGAVNQTIPCDGRCYNARGHNCECQCGGHNHGAGNAAHAGMVA